MLNFLHCLNLLFYCFNKKINLRAIYYAFSKHINIHTKNSQTLYQK